MSPLLSAMRNGCFPLFSVSIEGVIVLGGGVVTVASAPRSGAGAVEGNMRAWKRTRWGWTMSRGQPWAAAAGRSGSLRAGRSGSGTLTVMDGQLCPQQRLYFLPDPHGQGSLRPTLVRRV